MASDTRAFAFLRQAFATCSLVMLSISLLSACSSPSAGSSSVSTSSILTVTPAATTLMPGTSVTLSVAGGSAPYSYTLQSGIGSVTSSGIYTAPSTTGSAVVVVQDSAGSTGTCNITVSLGTGTNNIITISPQNSDLALGGTLMFSATGGTAPYNYSVTSGYGTFSGSTFTAANTAGTVSVTVTDSLQNTAMTYIYVGSAVGSTNVVNVQSYFSTQLTGYNPGCTARSPFGAACNSAIDGYCRNNGFETGYGPISWSGGDVVTFTCITKSEANIVNTTYSALRGFDAGCGADGNPYSSACRSAAFRLCKAQGYTSGFGPLEDSNGVNGTAAIGCMGTAASVTNVPYTEMTQFNSGCTTANPDSLACNNAVYQYCVANNYASGFGFLEYSGGNVTLSCAQ